MTSRPSPHRRRCGLRRSSPRSTSAPTASTSSSPASPPRGGFEVITTREGGRPPRPRRRRHEGPLRRRHRPRHRRAHPHASHRRQLRRDGAGGRHERRARGRERQRVPASGPATEAGVEVEVISGVEEARLIHLGVLQAVPVFDRRLLLVRHRRRQHRGAARPAGRDARRPQLQARRRAPHRPVLQRRRRRAVAGQRRRLPVVHPLVARRVRAGGRPTRLRGRRRVLGHDRGRRPSGQRARRQRASSAPTTATSSPAASWRR